MRQTTTLARRSETDERAEQILASALKGRGGALTRADAIALSGLSAAETDAALKSLLRDYKSHIAVTEQGELLYKFDPAMVRRDAPSLKERLQEIGRAMWKAFTFLFKIWIVATLIFYVIAFIAMMIALIFAQTAGDRNDRRRDRGGFGINPWLLWWLMPDWRPAGYGSGDGGWGRPQRQPRLPEKRFYQSVFDYVFGPKAPPRDPLAAEKEVVGYLRSARGRITATDLVALTGWSYDEAEEEGTRLLASYDGEPEVAEDGTLVYVFPELRRTAEEASPIASSQGWSYAWRQKHELAPLTGNTSGANTAITVMNGFNLFASLVIGPAFLQKFGIASDAANLVVTAFPLAFSTIFFAVPGGRAWRRSRAQRRLAGEVARAQVIGEIVSRKGGAAAPSDIVKSVVDRARVDAGLAKRALEKLLVDLDGDVTTNEAGQTLYAFPRVAAELAAAEAARALAPGEERRAGEVVFSSEGEGDDEVPSLPGTRPPRQLH